MARDFSTMEDCNQPFNPSIHETLSLYRAQECHQVANLLCAM